MEVAKHSAREGSEGGAVVTVVNGKGCQGTTQTPRGRADEA